MPAPDPLHLAGTTIAEKYAVESVVGEGGFAVVYRATHLIWKRPVALGHTDSRMVERVYGRMPIESLRNQLAQRVGDCSAFVANTSERRRSKRPKRQPDRQKAAETVPRDGIEPPTRGFSIPCSTN